MKTGAISCLTLAVVAFASLALPAWEEKVQRGVYYGPEEATEYQKEKCKLDVFLPSEKFKNFPVLVFFHGGGLTGGSRGGPNLTSEGVCLVAPSYRLNPKAQCPDYLNDAADAVAWTFKNIEKYGGDPNRVFISGSSAGSYLAAMITMHKSWLETRGVDIDKIAGLIPVSGQEHRTNSNHRIRHEVPNPLETTGSAVITCRRQVHLVHSARDTAPLTSAR